MTRSVIPTPRETAVRPMVAHNPLLTAVTGCVLAPAKYRAPTTAIPTDVPIRCPVCSTPPADPPRTTGTSTRVRVWFGEMMILEPIPAMNNGNDIHQTIEVSIPTANNYT